MSEAGKVSSSSPPAITPANLTRPSLEAVGSTGTSGSGCRRRRHWRSSYASILEMISVTCRCRVPPCMPLVRPVPDCERFVRGARRRAREARRAVEPIDLMEEIDSTDCRYETEMFVAAVHEAGHAVAICELCPDALQPVSLRASEGRGVSTTAAGAPPFLFAENVHHGLAIFLAGRAAEHALLNDTSSRAGGGPDCDLAQATLLAATAASALGFNKELGLLWSGLPDAVTLPDRLAEHPAIAAEVRRMLDQAYRYALVLMNNRREALSALADVLSKRRFWTPGR